MRYQSRGPSAPKTPDPRLNAVEVYRTSQTGLSASTAPGLRPVEANRETAVRAAQAAQAARQAGAHYRRDWADAPSWDEIARERRLRLPYWYEAPTPAKMRRWLTRLGISVETYLDWAGEPTLSTFAKRNPHWPLRAWLGMLLLEQQIGAFAPSTGEPAQAA
jgi:hypothetical protein